MIAKTLLVFVVVFYTAYGSDKTEDATGITRFEKCLTDKQLNYEDEVTKASECLKEYLDDTEKSKDDTEDSVIDSTINTAKKVLNKAGCNMINNQKRMPCSELPWFTCLEEFAEEDGKPLKFDPIDEELKDSFKDDCAKYEK